MILLLWSEKHFPDEINDICSYDAEESLGGKMGSIFQETSSKREKKLILQLIILYH